MSLGGRQRGAQKDREGQILAGLGSSTCGPDGPGLRSARRSPTTVPGGRRGRAALLSSALVDSQRGDVPVGQSGDPRSTRPVDRAPAGRAAPPRPPPDRRTDAPAGSRRPPPERWRSRESASAPRACAPRPGRDRGLRPAPPRRRTPRPDPPGESAGSIARATRWASPARAPRRAVQPAHESAPSADRSRSSRHAPRSISR